MQAYCKKNPQIQIEPVTAKIIYKSFEIVDIPELHDRIIARTAYYKNVKLITYGPMMIASRFVTTVHWWCFYTIQKPLSEPFKIVSIPGARKQHR